MCLWTNRGTQVSREGWLPVWGGGSGTPRWGRNIGSTDGQPYSGTGYGGAIVLGRGGRLGYSNWDDGWSESLSFSKSWFWVIQVVSPRGCDK